MRPTFAGHLHYGASRLEVVMKDGQLDHLPERFDLEGHLRPALAGHFGEYLVAQTVTFQVPSGRVLKVAARCGAPHWQECSGTDGVFFSSCRAVSGLAGRVSRFRAVP